MLCYTVATSMTNMIIVTINAGSPNTLRPVLIFVSCLLVVASLLMFIIGFICGQYFNQRCHRKLTRQERSRAMSTAAASKHVENLELNENVAYVTLRPNN